jgi:hypothetical protein
VNLLDSEEQFRNTEMKHRAAFLLHRLLFPGQRPREHKMMLNKIICGITLAEPLYLNFRATTTETREMKQLLNAIIDHWAPLKNTSHQGLLQSFFIREGLMKRQERDWQVHVERKGVDLLLDQIPWSYSMLKFPWNNFIIFTAW